MSGALRATQFAFAAHIRDPLGAPRPADVEARRMAVYTELFFSNVESLLSANFPVIRRLHDDAAWSALVRGFLRDYRAHTPLFTEIAREFIRYLEQRAEQHAGDPPFLVELAHYEWSELALSLDETDLEQVACDRDGDVVLGVPVLSPLVRVLAYRYAVQRISPEFRPQQPEPQPNLVLLVRDRADAIRFTEIDPLTALLVERLGADGDETGGARIDRLLADLGRAGEPALQASGRAILARLRAGDAILGTR